MKIKKVIRAIWMPFLCGLLVFLLFRFVLFLGYVPSESMEPTISAGSFIIGSRLYDELHRGDIVIFERDGCYLVKRIAAVPGDIVYIDDENRSVSIHTAMADATRVLTVPEDAYFVLGDNAEASVDSRYWNQVFLGEENIVAVLLG